MRNVLTIRLGILAESAFVSSFDSGCGSGDDAALPGCGFAIGGVLASAGWAHASRIVSRWWTALLRISTRIAALISLRRPCFIVRRVRRRLGLAARVESPVSTEN